MRLPDERQMYQNQEFPYLYETHLHTSRGSACGKSDGIAMADAYYQAGYTGIIVTEHNWGGNTAVDRTLPWEDFVHEFIRGYEEAKKRGDEIGLQVFFGWEAGYHGTEFLIYGLSPAWMRTHPEIRDASVEEQFQLVTASGGIVVHAHPFREECYIPEVRLYPTFVSAVEGINACHSNPKSRYHYQPDGNELAVAYARKHHLPMTAGSDLHDAGQLLGGGMAFRRKLRDEQDFIHAVVNREACLLTDGESTVRVNSDGAV